MEATKIPGKNPKFSNDAKSKGFGAQNMKGKDPTEANVFVGASETPAENASNTLKEDKGS